MTSARERLQIPAGLAVLGGFLHHYYILFLRPAELNAHLAARYESVVNGTADAPFQYRVLVPRLVVWLHHLSGLQYRLVAVFVDGTALAVGGLAVLAALRAKGLGQQFLPCTLYITFVGYGTTTFFWKPETIVAFLGASIVVVVFCQPVETGDMLILSVGCAILAGTRTDVLAALAVAFAARWWFGRRTADAVTAVGMLAAAGAATELLIRIYPRARYPTGTSVVQVGHNVRLDNLLIPMLFLAPVLLPVLATRRPRLDRLGGDIVALALSGVAFAMLSLAVGRVEEVRLWFPLAGVLAIVGARAWTVTAEPD